ncbi:hypothetical protein WG66_006668 [Moniliophthora roreri]|uniref:Uncharacterized protein n=1 Tax=Moniliophthora roreri TaxID=221103 RepID=A0A0W0ETD9_MONRR|nr:hypothetical protein WG66_006668 [Moniliophthora roreri]
MSDISIEHTIQDSETMDDIEADSYSLCDSDVCENPFDDTGTRLGIIEDKLDIVITSLKQRQSTLSTDVEAMLLKDLADTRALACRLTNDKLAIEDQAKELEASLLSLAQEKSKLQTKTKEYESSIRSLQEEKQRVERYNLALRLSAARLTVSNRAHMEKQKEVEVESQTVAELSAELEKERAKNVELECVVQEWKNTSARLAISLGEYQRAHTKTQEELEQTVAELGVELEKEKAKCTTVKKEDGKDEDEDASHETDDIETEKLRELRKAMQRVMLCWRVPDELEMPTMNVLFSQVEAIKHVTAQQLSSSRMRRFMRHISELDKKKYKIPRDDEFNFRKRAKALVSRWGKETRVASVKLLDLEKAKVASMETELQRMTAENESLVSDVGSSGSRLQMEKEAVEAQVLDWKRKYVVLQQEKDDLERRYIVANWSSKREAAEKATETLGVIEQDSEWEKKCAILEQEKDDMESRLRLLTQWLTADEGYEAVSEGVLPQEEQEADVDWERKYAILQQEKDSTERKLLLMLRSNTTRAWEGAEQLQSCSSAL